MIKGTDWGRMEPTILVVSKKEKERILEMVNRGTRDGHGKGKGMPGGGRRNQNPQPCGKGGQGTGKGTGR